MSNIYCDYKNNRYKAKLRNENILITAKEKQDGFRNYVDVLGNEHANLFMKEVNLDEVDFLYEECISINYKGNFFQLFAGEINKSFILNNLFVIWTSSEEIAQQFGFEKKEQLVFTKNITREEIESVKIEKKPIAIFKGEPKKEVILEHDYLEKWFATLA
ncbi:hypothetical protein R2R35_22850 [Anaerocolumna sp. AGMB13020]|uniref:hypothetical protein n=1 Tax=Anaerocolumna sp. AGMB13020 TaxID=3081750 RepID=UPI0029548110|nr:hypothetical protein [Anaerocolumna sp. AGMB13020]WOO36597.1 hypothetical protein R2R35_22850 [Anaerocolumna sp. AGMB13020]